MAAIFPKSTDLIIKVAGPVIGWVPLAGVGAYAYYTYPTVIDTGYQPVPAGTVQPQAARRTTGAGLFLLPFDSL